MKIIETETLKIKKLSQPNSFTDYGATLITEILNDSIQNRSVCNIAISGGSTPLPVFDLLVKEYADSVQWKKVNVFWVDERCVAPDHSDSNFGTAEERLLRHLPGIRSYRIRGEASPEKAANEYAKVLNENVELQNNLPEFDLILLGMGDDGHTASLFPGTSVLNNQNKCVISVWVKKLKAKRITLTFPVLNNARNRIIMITGYEKYQLFRKIQQLKENKYPIQYIYPSRSNDSWLIGLY